MNTRRILLYQNRPKLSQSGINMVDLMMWLIIAALLLAAAIQGIGYYQKGAYLYQMKENLDGAGSNSMTAATASGAIDRAAVEKGTELTKWLEDITYSIEEPTTGGLPYIRAMHSGVEDMDAIYLFESCGEDYNIGVNVIPKGGTPVLEECGIAAPPVEPGDGTGGGGIGDGTGGEDAVLTGAGLAGWGDGKNFQLANGPIPTETQYGPFHNKTVTNIKSGVMLGDYEYCGLADGIMHCWDTSGYNNVTNMQKDGALAGKQVTVISSGMQHICVLADGAPYCNGSDEYSILGNGSAGAAPGGAFTPVDTSGVLNGKTITDIDVMYQHACVIADGAPYCWGAGRYGKLGNNNNVNQPSPVAVVDSSGVFAGKTIETISTGMEATCVLDTEGKAYCWGEAGPVGNYGPDKLWGQWTPVTAGTTGILAGKSFTEIEADFRLGTTCVINEGTEYCWGRTDDDTGSSVEGNTPFVSDMGVPASETIISQERTCLLTASGNYYCNGNLSIQNDAEGIADKEITEGAGGCVIADGQPWCKRYSGVEKLSKDRVVELNNDESSPIDIGIDQLDGKEINMIRSGEAHTCAVADGDVYCWGNNGRGQVGNGTTEDVLYPVKVTGDIEGKQIGEMSLGARHTCVTADGDLYCWGYNSYGQLGTNSYDASSTPVLVDTSGALNGKQITDVAAGGNLTCVIASDKPYCWGDGWDAQISSSNMGDFMVPTAIAGFEGIEVTEISANYAGACVLADGKPYCWGSNWDGEWDASGNYVLTPKAVDMSGAMAGKKLSSLTLGDSSACALSDGKAYCWGANYDGQLGNGGTENVYTPTAVPLEGTVTAVDAGGYYACAVTNGSIYCWGSNSNGQLGNGTKDGSLTPVAVKTDGALTGKTVAGIDVGENNTYAIYE